MAQSRSRAREIANQYLSAGNATGWFERLYAEAAGNPESIPWADLKPNPNLTAWYDEHGQDVRCGTALVVGSGLGDDAENLAGLGFDVTAFDIAPTAVNWCRQRFPKSALTYEIQDLFCPAQKWHRQFDLVFEAYTLQVLPSAIRLTALRQIAEWVSERGALNVITRGRDVHEPDGQMPWPLARQELDSLAHFGLRELRFEDYFDAEVPPVRRFCAEYRRDETMEPVPEVAENANG